MTDYLDLVTRLRAEATRKSWTAQIMSDGTTVVHPIMREAADALEHAAVSHDMMVEQIETLTRERDEAREDTSVARQSLYEVAEQRNAVLARAEKTEQDRDELFASAQKCSQKLSVVFDECDVFRALLREAGEALEVFSANAELYADDAPGNYPVTEYLSRFRRARAVLACIKEVLNDSK